MVFLESFDWPHEFWTPDEALQSVLFTAPVAGRSIQGPIVEIPPSPSGWFAVCP
jgi:hypothetical protein